MISTGQTKAKRQRTISDRGTPHADKAMASIEEVRAAEEKVQKVLEALRKAGAGDPNNLSDELRKATDEYARAVRELDLGSHDVESQRGERDVLRSLESSQANRRQS